MPAEYFFPYDHLGRLHNEGVEYVIHKLGVREPEKFSKKNVMELTAEFMYLIDCCDAQKNDFLPKSFSLSKIKYVRFIEFLSDLQQQLNSKSLIDFAKDAGISEANQVVIEMIFSKADEIDGETVNTPDKYEIILQMLDLIEETNLKPTAKQNDKRTIGVLASVSRASILHGLTIARDPKLISKYEFVNSLAEDTDPNPSPEKRKFRWPWKADAEGALGGLISGGIGAVIGGPVSAAIGGLLGAVGGSISNSLIKSIPAFRSSQ